MSMNPTNTTNAGDGLPADIRRMRDGCGPTYCAAFTDPATGVVREWLCDFGPMTAADLRAIADHMEGRRAPAPATAGGMGEALAWALSVIPHPSSGEDSAAHCAAYRRAKEALAAPPAAGGKPMPQGMEPHVHGHGCFDDDVHLCGMQSGDPEPAAPAAATGEAAREDPRSPLSLKMRGLHLADDETPDAVELREIIVALYRHALRGIDAVLAKPNAATGEAEAGHDDFTLEESTLVYDLYHDDGLPLADAINRVMEKRRAALAKPGAGRGTYDWGEHAVDVVLSDGAVIARFRYSDQARKWARTQYAERVTLRPVAALAGDATGADR